MTNTEIKTHMDAKIERLMDTGQQIVSAALELPDGDERAHMIERGRLTFLAGVDIACRATHEAIKHQKLNLKYS